MAIGNVSNGEAGLSVRNKLNDVINLLNGGNFLDSLGDASLSFENRTLSTSTGTVIDWANQIAYDGSGFKAMEFTNAQRQLFDFTGSYPSIDYGNYKLYNIGISNSVPLLDWNASAGGSVQIYDGYNNVIVGDFSNKLLLNSSGQTVIDWATRYLYDNTLSVSIDWDYHLLSDINGTSMDWQNKLLYSNSFGSVISVDYGQHFLNDGGGFLSIDYSNRVLYANGGAIPILNFNTQADIFGGSATFSSVGGININTADTFDGYTVAQIVQALRTYGLLQ